MKKNKNQALPRPEQSWPKLPLPAAYSTLAAEQMAEALNLEHQDYLEDIAAEEARDWVEYDQL